MTRPPTHQPLFGRLYPRDVNLNYPRPRFFQRPGHVEYAVKLLPQAHRIRITKHQLWMTQTMRTFTAALIAGLGGKTPADAERIFRLLEPIAKERRL